ncbi:hypothetical protein Celaphus_00002444 [Cervus elaphus hippelaphus]|uniref:Uncharacterized protein n=1 Tax=Cervus elaphus hippelaphus TaxID=46360 RepID=A0A212CF26_CEREH|nr:hypothetical protein Celaphus_00002444 [Cervus elaphus hippelaphus]
MEAPGEGELPAGSGHPKRCISNFRNRQNGCGRGWLELVTPAIIVMRFQICQ